MLGGGRDSHLFVYDSWLGSDKDMVTDVSVILHNHQKGD